jgi:hypothetical protein
MCELYEGLKEMTIAEISQKQKEIMAAKKNNKQDESIITVVKLGKCLGMHFYHKECIDNMF